MVGLPTGPQADPAPWKVPVQAVSRPTVQTVPVQHAPLTAGVLGTSTLLTTVTAPVLKLVMRIGPFVGATSARKRKLYSVLQRIALALGFVPNASVVHATAPAETFAGQSVPL